MHHYHLLWASALSIGLTTSAFAQVTDTVEQPPTTVATSSNTQSTTESVALQTISANTEDNNDQDSSDPEKKRFAALKELTHIKFQDLKVNANAAQEDQVKDPLQSLNREIFKFNDMLDRNVARPLAVQYAEKVPEDVRGAYRSFRKNMGEPWNAVNQTAQGRGKRALKTLGRFTINTLTSLGFADPARRLGLTAEEDSLGTTLGYYGVPTGPYLMLPVLGPSTLRHSLDALSDGYAKPTNIAMLNHHQTGLAWSNAVLAGVDSRSQFLDIESVLQGDRYAAMRDIYLQRINFSIAEKKGDDTDGISFIDDEFDDETTP
ncbi:MlaA family lipoprotein [Acinetobacter larvae]|uniref:VacJ family lipoprotein n=1 Tax=Acinetobacter larvae TaxID=1789224 RepID=A0A1B2M1S4_9GAMM|nr:VacJ family lipoprotein [Acinetobacter larvae]AOA59138.1 hypothetical protein BFG52_12780 [Acinetobacter larvae]